LISFAIHFQPDVLCRHFAIIDAAASCHYCHYTLSPLLPSAPPSPFIADITLLLPLAAADIFTLFRHFAFAIADMLMIRLRHADAIFAADAIACLLDIFEREKIREDAFEEDMLSSSGSAVQKRRRSAGARRVRRHKER